MSQLGQVKVWIDAAGHYQRPEIIRFGFNSQPLWADEKKGASVEFNAVERNAKEIDDTNGRPARKGEAC